MGLFGFAFRTGGIAFFVHADSQHLKFFSAFITLVFIDWHKKLSLIFFVLNLKIIQVNVKYDDYSWLLDRSGLSSSVSKLLDN